MRIRAWLPLPLPLLACAWACASVPQLRFASPAPGAAQDGLTRPELVVQAGLSGGVLTTVFSPDGRRVAGADRGGTVVVWDAVSRAVLARIPNAGLIETFSPDGSVLATIDTRRLLLWDATTGASKGSVDIVGDDGVLLNAAFSHDGALLALAVSPNGVVVWDLRTSSVVQATNEANLHSDRVTWHPSKNVLAVLHKTREVKILDVDAGTSESFPLGEEDYPAAFTFAADGALLLLNKGRIVDVRTQSARPLAGAGEKAHSARFSTDGVTVTALVEKQPHVWDVRSGALIGKLATEDSPWGDGNMVPAVAGDGRLALRSEEGLVTIVMLGDGPRAAPAVELGGTGSFEALAWSPDGRWLVAATRDTLAAWDTAAGRLSTGASSHWTDAGSVSAIGTLVQRVDCGDNDCKALEVVDVAHAHARTQIRLAESLRYSHHTAISPDGARVVVVESDHAQLYDAKSGGHTARLSEVKGNQYRPITFSRDSKRLFVSTSKSQYQTASVTIYDAASGARLKYVEDADAQDAAISGDGAVVAFCGPAGVRAVDVGSNSARTIAVEAGIGRLDRCVFASNSLVLAGIATRGQEYALDASTLRVFDVEKQREVARLPFSMIGGQSAPFALDPTGAFLAVAGTTLEVHRIAEGSVLALHAFPMTGGSAHLATTRDGAFDGDDAAFSKVFFRVGGALVSADQLFERFHHPNLITEFLGGKAIAPKADVAAGIGPAPDVELLDVPRETASETLAVRVRVVDRGGGVSEVRVFVNGARLGGDGESRGFKRSSGSAEHTIELTLSPGANEIAVEAYNVQGKVRSERATAHVVVRAGDTARPNLYVLAASFNDYDDPSLKLGYSNADADAIVAALGAQTRLFGEVKVKRLRDKEATRTAIAQAAADIAKEARPIDVFVFFAAGHGVMLQCEGDDSPHYQLLTYRASLRSDRTICAESIGDAQLAALVRAVPAQKKLVLLDTCHAGGAATGKVLVAMRGGQDIDAIKRLARAEGIAVVTAAMETDAALEVADLKHGIFSFAVLEALGGKASRSGAAVTVSGLIDYLDVRVPELSQQYFKRSQYPIQSMQGQPFPLALP